MIEYKGYIARVEYDDSVDLLHGSVANSGDYSIATCEASDVQTLKKEFRTSIDEYLAACGEYGIEPIKPFSGNISIRLDADLHYRVVESAARDGMASTNG